MKRIAALAAVLAVASLPALMFPHVIPRAAALYELADGPSPYFVPDHALLLYLMVPVVAISACIFLLTPGLFLTIALGRARTIADWVLYGFILNLVVVSVATALVQALTGTPLQGGNFVATVGACALLAFGICWLTSRRSNQRDTPWDDPFAKTTIASMIVVPALLLIVLLPKFLWEAFNGDGAHAYEATRLLLHRALPFWDQASGEIAGFPGLTSVLFAYPASWFLRLFGAWEVSARLPLLLFLPPLFGALIALIGHDRSRAPGKTERWLIWLAIVIYTVVIAFSASYSPYSADIALPATQDTLLVVCFLGFVLSFLRRDWGFAALCALLTHLSLPNGFLLIAFWLIAALLVWKREAKKSLAIGASILVGCIVFSALAPRLLLLVGARPPGGEYGLGALLLRFAFLQVTDVSRLAFIILPCGIIPALSLVLWRRQDYVARAFTLVTVAAFLFAFVQLHAPLHYYIPAMLLPLVVFWRMGPAEGRARGNILAGTAAAAIGALILSWPANARPFTAARMVGAAIENRVGGYDGMATDVFRASTLIRAIIPYDWDPRVPNGMLGGSPVSFNVYAQRAGSQPRNYVLQRAEDPPPPGARQVTAEDGFAVYVRDESVWRSHLALRPPTPTGSVAYRIPRGILFRSVPLKGGPWVIDMPALAERMGIDVNGLAARLGVGNRD